MSPEKRRRLNQATIWINLVCGILFIGAGLRDLIAPDFLSLSHPTRSGIDIGFAFVAGALFLVPSLIALMRMRSSSVS
jgi:hypothetical protein